MALVCLLLLLMFATELNAQSVNCDRCMFISLVLDMSSSIGNTSWEETVVAFARKFATTNRITIGPGVNEAKIAVTVFGTQGSSQWDFNSATAQNTASYQAGIDNLDYPGFQLTNLGDALGLAKTDIDNINIDLDCDTVCMVVSDGEVNPIPSYQNLMTQNTPLYASACNGNSIGVGVTSGGEAGLNNINNLYGPSLFSHIVPLDTGSLDATFDSVLDFVC